MGLYDRDYMRKRQGRRDRYHSWLEDSSEPVRPSARGSSWGCTILITFALVFGLLLLPQFTIAGHHWRFWLF